VKLNEYRAVRIPFEEPSIPDEDVDKAMEQLRQTQSILEPVDRPAQQGDVLTADVKASVVSDSGKNETLEFEGQENPQELTLDENLGGRYPGAGRALEGIREGESRTASFRYPDTFPIERLKGLQAQITVKCLGVKVRKTPDWSEDVVKAVSSFSSVEELRKDVRARLAKHAEESREEEYADSVIEKMVEGAEIAFPPALLEEEISDEIQTLARRLQQRKTSFDAYLRTVSDGMAGLRKQLEPDARRKLIRRLLLTELVKHENLEPAPADVDEQMSVYQSMFAEDRTGKARNKENMEATLRHLATNDVLSRMIVRRVVEIGRGTAPAPSAAESQPSTGGSQ
jgi:trigger factor